MKRAYHASSSLPSFVTAFTRRPGAGRGYSAPRGALVPPPATQQAASRGGRGRGPRKYVKVSHPLLTLLETNVQALALSEQDPSGQAPSPDALSESMNMPIITKSVLEMLKEVEDRSGDFADLPDDFEAPNVLYYFRNEVDLDPERPDTEFYKAMTFLRHVDENGSYPDHASPSAVFHAYLVFSRSLASGVTRCLVAAKRNHAFLADKEAKMKGLEKSTGIPRTDNETDEDYISRLADLALEGEERGLDTEFSRNLLAPRMYTKVLDELKGKDPVEVASNIALRVHPRYKHLFVQATEESKKWTGKAKRYEKRHRVGDSEMGESCEDCGPTTDAVGAPKKGLESRASKLGLVSMRFD